jgi:hypothetical protein
VTKGEAVRAIGLDVHRDFCEVAISEAGEVRSAGLIVGQVVGGGVLGQCVDARRAHARVATYAAALGISWLVFIGPLGFPAADTSGGMAQSRS